MKNGSERVVDDARSHIATIKMLRNFYYVDEKGKDQGLNGKRRVRLMSIIMIERVVGSPKPIEGASRTPWRRREDSCGETQSEEQQKQVHRDWKRRVQLQLRWQPLRRIWQ